MKITFIFFMFRVLSTPRRGSYLRRRWDIITGGYDAGGSLGHALVLGQYIYHDQRTSTPGVKQVWLADDSAGGGQIVPLNNWYSHLNQEGKKYGYLVNGSKSSGWLLSRKYLQMRQRGCWRWGQYYNWRSAPFRGRHRISRVQRSILSGKGPWMERRTRSTIWDSKEPASCSLHCFHGGL